MKLGDSDFLDLIPAGVAAPGPATLGRLEAFLVRLAAENDRHSLVSRRDLDHLVDRHVLDSIQFLAARSPVAGARWADLGSGNGFPGMVLAILEPGLEMHLVESTGKARFLEAVRDELALANVRVHHARAEDLGRGPPLREFFDVVVARALARLDVVLEYALPLLGTGGVLITPRGPDGPRETREVARVLAELGAGSAQVVPYCLPGEARFHRLTIPKLGPTPTRYPRPTPQIARQPLIERFPPR